MMARRQVRRRRLVRVLIGLIAAATLAIAGGLLFLILAAVGSPSPSQGDGDAEAAASALRYRRDPGAVYDRPVTTPAPTPTPAPTAVAGVPPLRDYPFRMLIERIGVDAPVGTYGLDASLTPQVPLNAYEVAWYDFSAQPGTGGNAVFAGHVTWSGQAVFYRLNQMASGDKILLRGEDGTELLYTVSESFMVDPNDPSALSVMSPTTSDVLTIITCDGSFYYTGDPTFRGDYTHRRIVRAALTSVTLVAADAEGRIQQETAYYETLTFMRQLGLTGSTATSPP